MLIPLLRHRLLQHEAVREQQPDRLAEHGRILGQRSLLARREGCDIAPEIIGRDVGLADPRDDILGRGGLRRSRDRRGRGGSLRLCRTLWLRLPDRSLHGARRGSLGLGLRLRRDIERRNESCDGGGETDRPKRLHNKGGRHGFTF
ncbi:hypothetical protein ACVWY2_007207 [Bradyrhizobium sp. JR6.1]